MKKVRSVGILTVFLVLGLHVAAHAGSDVDLSFVSDQSLAGPLEGEQGDSSFCCLGAQGLHREDCCRRPFESDHAFDSFISPVTNTLWFLDPRSLTQVQGLFMNQMIPEDSPLAGGDIQLYAMRASLALNERFSLVAVKDGFVNLQADGIPNEDGYADIAAGIQYVFVRDVENQFLLSGSLIYELDQGSGDVFQGNGDGMWHMIVTSGKAFGDAHVLGAAGWHLPNHGGQESESLFYSLHVDYELCEGFYPLLELNGILYTQSGNRTAFSVEGGDLINLGASDVAGNHFVSMAVGATKVFSPHLSFGAAWEFPITGREDLFDNRLTTTLTFRY